MAKNQKTIDKEVLDLVPNVIKVNDEDGTELVIANNIQENKFLNMIMIARTRAIYDKKIAIYREHENLSPKELRDLVAAAKDLAEFSDLVYANSDSISPNDPTKVEPTKTDALDMTMFNTTVKPEPPKE